MNTPRAIEPLRDTVRHDFVPDDPPFDEEDPGVLVSMPHELVAVIYAAAEEFYGLDEQDAEFLYRCVDDWKMR